MKEKTLQEVIDEFIECDNQGEDALKTVEECRDSVETLTELGLKSAFETYRDVIKIITAVLVNRKKTGNTYGMDLSMVNVE